MQPLFQWKINKCYTFWVCICSPRYTAWRAHTQYCHLWPVRLYNIFPHNLIKIMIFERKLLNIKYALISLQVLSETFFILRRNERDMIKNVHWSSCKSHSAEHATHTGWHKRTGTFEMRSGSERMHTWRMTPSTGRNFQTLTIWITVS